MSYGEHRQQYDEYVELCDDDEDVVTLAKSFDTVPHSLMMKQNLLNPGKLVVFRSVSQYYYNESSTSCTAICLFTLIDILNMRDDEYVDNLRIIKWILGGTHMWNKWFKSTNKRRGLVDINDILRTNGLVENYRPLSGEDLWTIPKKLRDTIRARIAENPNYVPVHGTLPMLLCSIQVHTGVVLTVCPYTVLIVKMAESNAEPDQNERKSKKSGSWWFFDSHGRDAICLGEGNQSVFMRFRTISALCFHLRNLFGDEPCTTQFSAAIISDTSQYLHAHEQISLKVTRFMDGEFD